MGLKPRGLIADNAGFIQFFYITQCAWKTATQGVWVCSPRKFFGKLGPLGFFKEKNYAFVYSALESATRMCNSLMCIKEKDTK